METSEILNKFSPDHENMLGILHALQDNNPHNYLNDEDISAVAKYLNTPIIQCSVLNPGEGI